MDFTTPLYNLNPLNRFTNKAENYTKYRPLYPDAVIDKLLESLTLPITVADIGAGTGISARQLASHGVDVIAIEPNLAMRKAAISSPGIEWKEGTAEHTNLPDASVDLITCFQAFHWFKPEPTLSEFRRILKPKGRLGIVFQDLNRDDEFTQAYWQIISKAANNRPPSYLNTKIAPVKESSYFQYIDYYEFDCQQNLDLKSLIGLAQSVSFIPADKTIQNQLVEDLKTLHQNFCDGTWVPTIGDHSSDTEVYNPNNCVYMAYHNTVHIANAAVI